MLKIYLYIFSLILVLTSCATLKNNAKYELADGKYKLKIGEKKYNCYVKNNADSIILYNLQNKISTNLPEQVDTYFTTKQHLIKPSVDLDILTAFFKIRPAVVNTLPTQLNTNFNGNLYLGYRTDIYQIHYAKTPLENYQRQLNHFGFSGGLFFGIGNTTMNPTTTNTGILEEYDGIIWQKGIAGIVAINKLTIGLSVGFDNLLDKNNKFWIYQHKPWIGLMLGLNLN